MFGSHLSIAGSMTNALREAESLGLECVQVFTKNQQQWSAPPLKPEVVEEWTRELARLGWDGSRLVSHASYLINLGSPDPDLRAKSLHLMRDELSRCITLGIGHLVFHPGAFTTSTAPEGIERIATAIGTLINETRAAPTVMCFENVAGAGTTIGRRFEELADLRARVIALTGAPERVGFCIDSCHAHAAGYDLSEAAGATNVLAELIATLGPGSVRVLHLNDSKGAAGSHLDRHEHIGRGTIGLAGFAAIVNHPAFARTPKIMETPKDDPQDGIAWDTVNVQAVRGLLGKNPRECPRPTAAAPARAVPRVKASAAATPPKGTRRPVVKKGKAGPATAPRRGPAQGARGGSGPRKGRG
ncbi:MAG: deoxyribonuclease IV [Phycisphaerales bacterium]